MYIVVQTVIIIALNSTRVTPGFQILPVTLKTHLFLKNIMGMCEVVSL
jgi:hypothetical protein